MISTATIRERSALPHTDTHPLCNRWPDKVTVDISLLLKPKEDGSIELGPSSSTKTGSPVSVARSADTSINTNPASQSCPTTVTTSTSSIPAKRSTRAFDHAVSESPAKKQSKWSQDEDSKIIQLRGEGMKWEDISKHLPGRSAISCRLHYQNYLERRSEWDEDRKNKLARLYERFKGDMWSRIAEEMAIPWRAAEAMHWQMGEHEMARRAGVTPFSLTTGNSTGMHSTNGFASNRSHHTRSASATPRLRRDSASQINQYPLQMQQQLPSLAELTAGLPAHAHHHHGIGRPYHGALGHSHRYYHSSPNSNMHPLDRRIGHDTPAKFYPTPSSDSERR